MNTSIFFQENEKACMEQAFSKWSNNIFKKVAMKQPMIEESHEITNISIVKVDNGYIVAFTDDKPRREVFECYEDATDRIYRLLHRSEVARIAESNQ